MIFPRMNSFFAARLILLVFFSLLLFYFILRPMYINGTSMEPTYNHIGFNFCIRPYFYFHDPHYDQIVIIRYAGEQLMLFKRIIGMPGDTIEFRSGKLWRNGVEIKEPYIKFPCDWNLEPRKVHLNNIYVVGDNRSMPMDKHMFGQVDRDRLYGVPLW